MSARTIAEFAARQEQLRKTRERIMLAALRKIRRIGYGGGVRTEESEIALVALRRCQKNGGRT